MSDATVVIHYHRPPDREQTFTQQLVARTGDCAVTLLSPAGLASPKLIDGIVALGRDAAIVWFTFAGAWHDIGRFHTDDGTFTGCYANVLTPVEGMDTVTWRTTDLFLDVWQPAGGPARILDVDELHVARTRGWVDQVTGDRAAAEAAALVEAAAAGTWPPPVVQEWPLERALRHVGL